MNACKHGLRIEQLATLAERAPELRGRLDEWLSAYRPASPGERELVEMAVIASVQFRRNLAAQAEATDQQIRLARLLFDQQQEDLVEEARHELQERPARGVLLLRRTAPGCRFLIGRLERLLGRLDADGTLYGNDRNELIRYLGAEPYPEKLFDSEGAYLTWLYCLMAQPTPPSPEALEAMGSPDRLPISLRDRPVESWLPPAPLARELLRGQIEGRLAELRTREGLLRELVEEPGRAGAERRRRSSRARRVRGCSGTSGCTRWTSTGRTAPC